MDLHDSLVSEALFSEVANKGWLSFLNKYENIDHPDRYFVNFTDFGSSVDDKRFVGAADEKKAPLTPNSYYNIGDKTVKAGPTELEKIYDKKAEKRATPDLTLFTTPSHSDPVGIYTYPLAYVLEKKDKIPLGSNMKYMRVLKTKPGINVLKLRDIQTRDDAEKILDNMGVYSFEAKPYNVWECAKKGVSHYSDADSDSLVSKIFFFILQ